METLSLKVLDASGHTLTTSHSCGDGIGAVHTQAYANGDRIVINTGAKPGLYMVQLDEALGQALLYLDGSEFSYPIPAAEKRVCFSPKAFTGNRHVMYVRPATPEEGNLRRNLACNPYDNHTVTGAFPHAVANVETRNEVTFAARNAIDGIFENASHGEYPYSSWGINRDPNAALEIQLGRPVDIDTIRLTLRADFPHDSWWTQALLTFSDGSTQPLALTQTHLPQSFECNKKGITSIKLDHLIKAEDASPFPALTQIEIWGTQA